MNDNDRFINYDDSMNAFCMIVDQGLNLSLLTENLFSDLDPRMCGNELGAEITMADKPPTISGIHGSLLKSVCRAPTGLGVQAHSPKTDPLEVHKVPVLSDGVTGINRV